MTLSLSLYLDGARLFAALAVVIAHLSEVWVAGFAPFGIHLGLEAVGVFFVLSGFVIGHVVETKERDWRNYTISRAARIYSVVVPCLFLTVLCNALGSWLYPAFYVGLADLRHDVASALLGLTFLDVTTIYSVMPADNAPFWSLNDEVFFYVAFGAVLFARGWGRWLALLAVGLLAGLHVVALFPLWLLGFWTYRACLVPRMSALSGRVFLLVAVLLWVLGDSWRWAEGVGWGTPLEFWGDGFWQLYWGGAFFAATVVGVRFAELRFSQQAHDVVRWLAGATFTLYLLHWPVDRLLEGVVPADWSPAGRWWLLLGGAVGAAYVVAEIGERRKNWWLQRFWRLERGRPGGVASEAS